MSADDKAGLCRIQRTAFSFSPSTHNMALSDGTKRFKTYGKHRSQVAVSHREWWSTVSETVAGSAASTSTAGQDSPVKYGKDGTSPSRRAAKKASSALVLDEDDEDDQKDIPAPKKQVPPPRAQSKSTNVRPRIVDIDDSDSDEEYRPSTSGNGHKASITASRSRSTAETPANKPIGSAIKAPDQQHGRVISLSSDTSEEDRLKPARRKPSVAKKAAPLARKRIIVEDTPPASPAVDSVQLGHVHNLQDSQGTGQLAADPAARESHLLHTLSMHTSGPVKPSVLTRKDSNYHNKAANAASLPLKKEAAVIVSTPVDHTSKHNIVAKESFHPSIIAKANTALKGSMSDKPAHTPMRVASSSQPPAHRLPSGITHARSLALRKQSSSSSSKSISLPPPRGHHSESVVTWRRPLVPIVPGSKGGSRAIKTYREQSSSSVLAEKMASAGRNYGSASSASSRSSNAGVSSQSSKSTHVVVEVPFGLPRSRSPAPVLKEARRRQTSVQSISSSSSRSSAMSSHEPSPVSSQRCESKSVNQTIPSTGSEDLVNSASQLGGTEKQDAATIESFTDIPKIPVLAGDDVPTEFIPLLEHCDGFQPSAASKVLDFTSFVASPIPLLSATPELPTSVRWRKLGEATFSEVFMVSEESLSTDSKAERGTVVKVIPLHMSPEQAAQEEKVEEAFAKGDNNVEEAFTSSIEDLAREIRIFRALSLQTKQARKGWPAFKGYGFRVPRAYLHRHR